jgi:hypothetical protein
MEALIAELRLARDAQAAKAPRVALTGSDP